MPSVDTHDVVPFVEIHNVAVPFVDIHDVAGGVRATVRWRRGRVF